MLRLSLSLAVFYVYFVFVIRAQENGAQVLSPECLLFDEFEKFPASVGGFPSSGNFVRFRNGRRSVAARYHIIPASEIRLFAKKALSDGNHRLEFTNFLEKLIANARSRGTLIEHGIEESLQDLGNTTFLRKSWRVSENSGEWIRTIVHALVTWLPFNFFVGPVQRGDSTANKFETNVEPIVGHYVFKKLSLLKDEINNFTQTGSGSFFHNAMLTMDALLVAAPTSYEIHRDNWIFDESKGTYQIRSQSRVDKHDKLAAEINFTVDADPYCLNTQNYVTEGLTDEELWYQNETSTLWNLKALNLVTTKKIVDSVKNYRFLEACGSWKFTEELRRDVSENDYNFTIQNNKQDKS